jgi:multiple sugar transport system permease protein
MSANAVPIEARLPSSPAVRARRITSAKLISNLVLIGFGILFTAPLLWLLFTSVDSQAGATLQWPHFTFGNYSAAANSTDMHGLLNSFYISAIATVVSTVPAALAAYAFSRHRIPFKGPLLLFILMLAGVPVTIIIVPVYQEFTNLNYLSLLPASIFLGVTSLPFEIWIIKNFIDAVPKDLEEAARLERAKTWHVLLRVVLPVALPGIAAAAIFGFINAWGNFLVPLVLMPNPAQAPAPVAIYGFFGGNGIRYGQVAAYSLMYSAPIVILYLAMSRLFRGGFSQSGAIRG